MQMYLMILWKILKSRKIEKTKNKDNRIFEDDDNNTKDEHKADETGDKFHSINIYLEVLVFQANHRSSNLERL